MYAWARKLIVVFLWKRHAGWHGGTPWRQLPAEYGKWNSVYRRYAHWCDRGVWRRLMTYLPADPDLSAVQLDSTLVRAHVSAAGAPQKPGTDHALGRSRGGFGTKIHILADRRGRHLRVTGGQRHDSTQARALVGNPGRTRRGPA